MTNPNLDSKIDSDVTGQEMCAVLLLANALVDQLSVSGLPLEDQVLASEIAGRVLRGSDGAVIWMGERICEPSHTHDRPGIRPS